MKGTFFEVGPLNIKAIGVQTDSSLDWDSLLGGELLGL